MPAEAAQHADVRVGGAHLAHLHRRGLVLELQVAASRRRRADPRDHLNAHQDAAHRRREVLHHDRDVDRLGHREVVTLERGIVGPRQLRRRHHHGARAQFLGAAAVGDAAVGAGVGGADANRKAAARRLHRSGNDAVALAFGQLVGLAEHAEDGHAVHALVAREHGEPLQAVDVERTIVGERSGSDVVDASEEVGHVSS